MQMKMSGYFVCFQANSHLQFGSPLMMALTITWLLNKIAQLLNSMHGEQLNDSSQSFVE